MLKLKKHGFIQHLFASNHKKKNKARYKKEAGFTLIELLVVISIIGLLTTLAVVAFQNARAKARDATRKGDLAQLVRALELRFNDLKNYPASAGAFTNPGHGGLDAALIPAYMQYIPDDPLTASGYTFYYFRKDDPPPGCPTGDSLRYGFYAVLEKPNTDDLASIQDSFDVCIRNTYGINYRVGAD